MVAPLQGFTSVDLNDRREYLDWFRKQGRAVFIASLIDRGRSTSAFDFVCVGIPNHQPHNGITYHAVARLAIVKRQACVQSPVLLLHTATDSPREVPSHL